MYKTTVKLVVPQTKFLKRGGVGREEYEGFGIGHKPDVRRILALLQSPQTQTHVIEKLDLARHYGYPQPDETEWRKIYDIYLDNVRFDDPKSNYVLMEIWDESPAFSQKIAQTLIERADDYWKSEFKPKQASHLQNVSRADFSIYENCERALLRQKRFAGRYHYDHMPENVSQNFDFEAGHATYDDVYAREYRLDVLEKHGAYNDARSHFAQEWTGVYDFPAELASSPMETRLADKPNPLEFTLVGAMGGALWGAACVMLIRLIRPT
ncbi:MAG: hypothetical protein RMM53_04185 [Bacteroidia bacterium]|nr:hypothetical protein [Bacteroidia bacterium]MDW8333396.1 hypothetical protein [Bacteroidia bacterium]